VKKSVVTERCWEQSVSRWWAIAVLAWCGAVSSGPAYAQEQPAARTSKTPKKVPVPLTQLENDEIRVAEMQMLVPDGQAVSWAPVPDRILVTLRGVDRYYRVYAVSPDGIKREHLTQRMRGTRLHRGNASWHPSGEYIVFTSQIEGVVSYRMSLPGSGLNSNIWLMDGHGRNFWKLTHLTASMTQPKGVVYPYFSPDGSKLAWAGNTGRIDPRKYTWGERAIYVADFHFDERGRPVLGEPRVLQPGDRKDFYEVHGFMPDGKRIIFSGDVRKNDSVYGMDICTYNLETGDLSMLTDSPGVWDEFAAISPDGRKIVWASNASQPLQEFLFRASDWKRFLRSEIWIMNSDGSDPVQLTHFNAPGSPEYIGRRVFVGDLAWSPDGTRIVAVLFRETRGKRVEPATYVLKLERRPENERTAGRRRPSQSPGARRAPRAAPRRPATPPRRGERVSPRPSLPLRY